MFAKIENNQVVEWPIQNLTPLFPNTSFPSPLTEADMPEGYVMVGVLPVPEMGQYQKAVPGQPIQQDGKWVQSWDVVPMSTEEIAESIQQLQAQIVNATQQRLDDFARARGYDSILSACTYATSTVPRFQADGQYCVNARDATWGRLYQMLGEVEAGQRPMPASFAEVEPELPILEWPQ